MRSRIPFRVGRALSSETVLHLKRVSFVFYSVTPNSTPESNPNWLCVSNDTMARGRKGGDLVTLWHGVKSAFPKFHGFCGAREDDGIKNLCSILKEKQGKVESKHSKNVAIYKPMRGFSLKSNLGNSLTLNFQPLELWEYKFLSLKLPCQWHPI